MKIKKKKFMTVLLMLAVTLIIFAPTAMAAEVSSGEIPVTTSLGGSPPTVEEDYKIIMEADHSAYPMPEGSTDGLFTMNITGADTVNLPGIEFSSLGIYTYTISQEAGSYEMADYDDAVYHLMVYVTNAGEGSGLETAVLLYRIGETAKLDEIVFHNHYDTIIIDDEDPPLGPGDKDTETIEDEETPIGRAKLPKTGGTPAALFLIAGATIVTAGVILKKKED